MNDSDIGALRRLAAGDGEMRVSKRLMRAVLAQAAGRSAAASVQQARRS